MSQYHIHLRFVAIGWPVVTPIILWWTGGWASHVDALRMDMMIVGASPFGGVRARPLGEHPGVSEIVTIPCTSEQRREFWAFMGNQIGKPYDWLGFLFFPLRRHDKHAWFCSEIIAAALQHAGIMSFSRPWHEYSPASLYDEIRERVA